MARRNETKVYEPTHQEAEQLRRGPDEQAVEGFSERLATVQDPTSATAEAYRALGNNLLYTLADAPSRIIVVTSPNSSAGKTTVCANLGVVLAQSDKSVLILDCDLHKPAVHKVFGLRNLQGLENVLAGERRLREVQQGPSTGLKVVTAGPVPPYPAELLSSKRFKALLNQGSSEFDYVLIDSPPLETVPDPLILATQGDGVLLVVDAQSTRKEAVRRAIRGLEGARANVLGTVMTNVKAGN